jgi:hypothetical protein
MPSQLSSAADRDVARRPATRPLEPAVPAHPRPTETPECPDSGIPAGAVPAEYGATVAARGGLAPAHGAGRLSRAPSAPAATRGRDWDQRSATRSGRRPLVRTTSTPSAAPSATR